MNLTLTLCCIFLYWLWVISLWSFCSFHLHFWRNLVPPFFHSFPKPQKWIPQDSHGLSDHFLVISFWLLNIITWSWDRIFFRAEHIFCFVVRNNHKVITDNFLRSHLRRRCPVLSTCLRLSCVFIHKELFLHVAATNLSWCSFCLAFFCQLSCFLSVKKVSFAVLLLKMKRLMLSFIFFSPVTLHFPSAHSKKEKAWRRTHFPKVSDKCVETTATFNSCHLSPPPTLSGSIVLVSETVSELFHLQTFT